jgi:phage tail tube protein FII
MAMPRKLKHMNVFLNGYSYQGWRSPSRYQS